MIKALIFDLDGTIIDTEKVLFEAYHQSFLDQYGFELELDLWAQYVGARGTPEKISKHAEEKLGVSVDSKKIIAYGQDIFNDLIEIEQPLPGVIDMLEAGKMANLNIGLATNSDTTWANRFIDRLDIRSYFDNIYTINHVSSPKPHPEIYTKSVQHFNVAPDEAIAFEDSVIGSLAAKRANLHTVVIPSKLTLNATFDHVDIQTDSMATLQLDQLIPKLTSEKTNKIIS